MIATEQSPPRRVWQRVRDAIGRSGVFARPTMIHPSRAVDTHGHEEANRHYNTGGLENDTTTATNVGHVPAAFGGWVESHLRSLRTP